MHLLRQLVVTVMELSTNDVGRLRSNGRFTHSTKTPTACVCAAGRQHTNGSLRSVPTYRPIPSFFSTACDNVSRTI